MIRILLFNAGPTKWDVEERLVGNASLPITPEAHQSIERLVASLTSPIDRVYRPRQNEACDQAARIVARHFKLRPHDEPGLEEPNCGLWQGLCVSELRSRYESSYGQWLEDPLSVRPPEGESIEDASKRIRASLRRVLKRADGVTTALAVRPMAMQLLLASLRGESLPQFGKSLHDTTAMEAIELEPDVAKRLLGDP
jgi:broad specificity phosphatase PhoE